MPRYVDHEAQKAQIAEAVLTVMARDGLEQVTMRKIAAELGSTTGLLTHYFGDREALIAHALDLQDRRLFDDLSAVDRDAVNGRDALRRTLQRLCLFADAVSGSVFFLRLAAAPTSGDMGERSRRMYRRFEAIVRTRVESAVADGSLVLGLSLRDATDSLVAAADGIYSCVIARPRRFPPRRRLELIDIAIKGVEKP